MKQIKNLTLLTVLASILFIMPACSDESETTPKASASSSKTSLITSSPWTLTQIRISDDNGGTWVDFTSFFDDCELDNTWSFGTNGTITVDEGPTKCDPADPQTDSMSWSFAENETKINLDGDLMDIIELTSTTLRVQSVDGLEITEITFSH